MPYPNEHAARVRQPGDFEKDSFRRKTIATGIDIIIGKLKGGDGSMVTQAYRFNAKVFTADEAKKWLKDHKISYISFEAASGKMENEMELLPDLYRIKGMAEQQGFELPQMVKDVDTKNGVITGYFSAFDVVDSDNETVVPGAFRRTIRERGPAGSKRVAFLRQHRPELLLGRPSILKEDKFGLYFESKIEPTSYGKDTLILYQGGALNEHSIGYDVVKQERTQDQPTRLLELRLWDGSAVTWGANPETPFLGFKSLKEWAKAFDQIDSINRALTDAVTDDTAMQLEISIRQFQQRMIDFVKCLKSDDSQLAIAAEAVSASRSEIAILLRKQLTEMQAFTSLKG